MQKIKLLFAKLVRRARPSALRNCDIHKTARVLSASQLTRVTMGQYSYCGYECRITACEIGAFVSVSDRVMIGGGAHTMAGVSMSPVFSGGRNTLKKNFSNHTPEPTVITRIGNDVWIGYAAIIKSGVTIGDGAVIGMGSVVTKNVPPYTIWAGNPARQIRQRFDNKTISRLLASQWWTLPDAKITALSEQFHDVEAFLNRTS